MEDMAAAVEAKEQAHAQELIDLERKLLTDKGNLQKVMKHDTGRYYLEYIGQRCMQHVIREVFPAWQLKPPPVATFRQRKTYRLQQTALICRIIPSNIFHIRSQRCSHEGELEAATFSYPSAQLNDHAPATAADGLSLPDLTGPRARD